MPNKKGYLKKRKKKGMSWGGFLLTTLVLFWFCLLILIPCIGIFKETINSDFSEIMAFLKSSSLVHAFWLTLLMVISAVFFNTIFGILLALLITRYQFRGKLVLESLLDLPFAISPVIIGFMLILLFGSSGWFGKILAFFNIKVIYDLPGMIIATLFVTFPFIVKEIIPILKEFGSDQEEAAKVLGASEMQTFFKVTLPTIKWGLGYGLTLTIARAIGEFGAVMVVSGSIINKTQTFTLLIHDQFTDFNYSGAFAGSIVLILVSVGFITLTQIFNERRGV